MAVSSSTKICWAASLGGCSDKRSREHLVSRALFKTSVVEVEGFAWCRDRKQVGLDRLTARILCTTHNSLLSEVDQEAARLFEFWRRASEMLDVRSRLKPRRWNVKRHAVCGVRLERWFLKTMIALLFAHPDEVRWSEAVGAHLVPREWVMRAYGLDNFPPGVGLYSVAKEGAEIHSSDVVSFAPIADSRGIVVAGLFDFRGLQFALSLTPLDSSATTPRYGRDDRWAGANMFYHHRKIEMKADGFLSHAVELRWT